MMTDKYKSLFVYNHNLITRPIYLFIVKWNASFTKQRIYLVDIVWSMDIKYKLTSVWPKKKKKKEI